MHLPRDSPLMSALADDPAFASGGAPRAPKLAEFGPDVEVLAGIHDLLGSLVSLVAGLGGQQVNVPPYPRPVTASALASALADKAAARREHRELVARMTGKGGPGG